MIRNRWVSALGFILAPPCILCSFPVSAKIAAREGGQGVAAATPATQDTAIAEIVITAQRRQESAQKAALAVDVLSIANLDRDGVNRASDLTQEVPALNISESGGGQQSLYLRGVGVETGNSYADPAVSFNVDGVAVARPSSMSGVFYDLARVEVVKGPQGTLYGRNSTGGAINILTNAPRIGVTGGGLTLSGGSHDAFHADGYANIAVNDVSALRLSGTYSRHDAYQTDGSGDQNSYAGRFQYFIKPTNDLSVRLMADYAFDGGHNVGGTLLGVINPFTGAITPSPLRRNVGLQDPAVGRILDNQFNFISLSDVGPIQGKPFLKDSYWGVTSEINWNTRWATLTVIPSLRAADLDNLSTAEGYAGLAKEHDQQGSVEARLASPNEGLVRWLLGGYHFNEKVHARYNFDYIALSPYQHFHTNTTSDAAFARVTIAPADRFRVSGGIRVTHDRKELHGESDILLALCGAQACPTTPGIPPALDFAQAAESLGLYQVGPNFYLSTQPAAKNNFFITKQIRLDDRQALTKVTGHAGVEYDVGPQSLLYANWDSGYHAGGFSFSVGKPTYRPEHLDAISIGSKNQLFGRRLQVDMEAFYWRYRDQQISHTALDPDGTTVFIVDNAGSSTIKGVESSVVYKPAGGWLFNVDVQYLDARYRKFTYQTPAGPTAAPPVTACPYALTDSTHYTVDCAGFTPLYSPRWTGNISVSKSFNVGRNMLVLQASTHVVSMSTVGFEMLSIERQKAYEQSNVALTFGPASERWSIGAFVNNIENVRPYGTVTYQSVANIFASTVGPPRSFGVRAQTRF